MVHPCPSLLTTQRILFESFAGFIRTVPTGTGIKSILAFITGTPLKPKEETVGFLPDEKGHSLPDPDTCACSLKIPTCFSTYGQFEAAVDATVRIQGKGYGRAVPVVI